MITRNYAKHRLRSEKVFSVTCVGKVPKVLKSSVLCEAHGLGPHNGPNYLIFDNTLEAALVGYVERLLRVLVKDDDGTVIMDRITGFPCLKLPPKPDKGIWKEHLYYERMVAQHVGKHDSWSEEEFCASRRDGRIRARYYRAYEDYKLNGLSPSDSDPQGMVKKEKMKAKSFITPRIIQFCNPKYNLLLGKYVSSAEKKIYEGIDLIWDPTGRLKTIMKGYNAEEVATCIVEAWQSVEAGDRACHLINQGDDNIIILRVLDGHGKEVTVAIVVDAERFDQHCHFDTIQFEHHLYKRIYKNATLAERKELSMLLKRQATYSIRAWHRSEIDGKTYRVDIPKIKGRRRSGDMNTSLGNNYIATSLLHGLLKDYKPMALDEFKEMVVSFSLKRGFSLKIEGYAECIEEIEFCQSHPINTGHTRVNSEGRTIERWIMVRNLDALVKDTTFICEERSIPERMSQIGIAGNAMYSDIPVMRQLYKQMTGTQVRDYLWDGTAWTSQGLAWQSGMGIDGMAVVSQASDTVTETARMSYERGFGVTPNEQLCAEHDLASYQRSNLKMSSTPWYAPWYAARDVRVRNFYSRN